MRKEGLHTPDDSPSRKRSEPKDVLRRKLSAKEAQKEVADYFDGKLERVTREGTRSREAVAREYVLAYAQKVLSDMLSTDARISEKERDQVSMMAVDELRELLFSSQEFSPDDLLTNYSFPHLASVKDAGVQSILHGYVDRLYREYRALINGEFRKRGIEIYDTSWMLQLSESFEISPAFEDDTIVIGDVRAISYHGVTPYHSPSVDERFLKNIFGIERGAPFLLDPTLTLPYEKSEVEYELALHVARKALYIDVFEGRITTASEASLQYPSLPTDRLASVIEEAERNRELFSKDSKKNLKLGLEKLKDLVRASTRKFVGIHYQEPVEGKKFKGGFYLGTSGISEIQPPHYSKLFARPVFDDDLFSVHSQDLVARRDYVCLGSQQIAHRNQFNGDDGYRERKVFNAFVTEQDYQEFILQANVLRAARFGDSVSHEPIPYEVERFLGGAYGPQHREVSHGKMVAEVLIRLNEFTEISRRQQDMAREEFYDQDMVRSMEEILQTQVATYLRSQDAPILLDVFMSLWRTRTVNYQDLLLKVLDGRMSETATMMDTILEKASQSEKVILRRTLWEKTKDLSYLYTTLSDILESGSDKLGRAEGVTRIISDGPLGKEFEWGQGDISTLIDQIEDIYFHGTHSEPAFSAYQARTAIDNLLANSNDMRPSIARFIPYIQDNAYLRSLIHRWSREAVQERFQDAAPPEAPFSSIPSIIVQYGNEALAREVMRDPSFSYETRLVALSARKRLKSTDLVDCEMLLSYPPTDQERDRDFGKSGVRVEVINRGLLDEFRRVLEHLAAAPHKIDKRVQEAADRRLTYLKNQDKKEPPLTE